jgi:hypothetical protein
MNVIMPRRLREMCHELLCDIFPRVKGTEAFADLVNAPGLAIHSTYAENLDASAWAQRTIPTRAA